MTRGDWVFLVLLASPVCGLGFVEWRAMRSEKKSRRDTPREDGGLQMVCPLCTRRFAISPPDFEDLITCDANGVVYHRGCYHATREARVLYSYLENR